MNESDINTDLIEFSAKCKCGFKQEFRFQNAPLAELAEACCEEVESSGWFNGECPTCHERNANEYKADFLADR